jgi:hypothetical protein
MLGTVPLALQLEQRPRNRYGRISFVLVEARLEEGKTPIEGESSRSGMGGELALLP